MASVTNMRYGVDVYFELIIFTLFWMYIIHYLALSGESNQGALGPFLSDTVCILILRSVRISHHGRQYMHLLIQSRVFICMYMHLCVPDIHINLHSPIHVWYPLVWIACASSTPGQTERAYDRRVRNEGLCKCISVYWRKIDVDVRLGRAVVLWLREWLLHSDVNPGSPDCEYLSSLWPHSPT